MGVCIVCLWMGVYVCEYIRVCVCDDDGVLAVVFMTTAKDNSNQTQVLQIIPKIRIVPISNQQQKNPKFCIDFSFM